MRGIFTADEQHAVLEHWRAHDLRDIDLLHVDEHCDARGLLVDRATNRAAHSVADPLKWTQTLYGGNFLTFAVAEGRVRRVRWVYGPRGGRSNDVETVKYLSDATAYPFRVADKLGRLSTTPLTFVEVPESEFDGSVEGEVLDIDWDFVASTRYAKADIGARAAWLVERLCRAEPDLVYVAYSPRYSHESRAAYEVFVAELASCFDLPVTRLPEPAPSRRPPAYLVPRTLRSAAKRWMRRHGIY